MPRKTTLGEIGLIIEKLKQLDPAMRCQITEIDIIDVTPESKGKEINVTLERIGSNIKIEIEKRYE
ncbi:MAG: hypothetical protein NXI00_20080 [Cytophagales bacterium]|nr:hypothetical protein [Cytophagales bacterium]